jgi:hypothetical protein
MSKAILPLAVVLLTACATTAPPVDEQRDRDVRELLGDCNAELAQGMIGKLANESIGAELLQLTGARTLRWVPPRTAVTMDYRSDRLTVAYDDDMAIERITCG